MLAAAELLQVTERLAHNLPEVRARAVDTLRFKLKTGILQPVDIANDQTLIFNVLNTINGDQTKSGEADGVLEVVLHIVQHPAAHRILLDLGAITFFRTMRQDAPA
ncbi:hypothetical protein HK097_001163, partial [Rhizophlyctis rosea]